MEIVGRHHDPFTVMEQFARPIRVGVYSQPVTDIPGALLARISGAVAAYNWLVLLSFPLSAAAAYLLARHLALSPAGATVAAMAYAFSPFHLAHAAYHPHIAQTQWVPLYLLALWRCLDRASPVAVGFLGAAAMAVTLSNFYGGLIAAVITPVAVAAYWFVTRRARPRDRCAGWGSRSRASCSSRPLGSAYASVRRSAPSSRTARRSRSRAPICSATARSGGATSFRRSSIRCSARPRVASGRGRRPRGAARTAGEPRLGHRRARAGRRLSLARPRSGRRLGVADGRVPVLVDRRRRRARVLAVAGADDRAVHLRPAVRAAVRRRADVPVVRAIRRRRAAHGGAAGGHRRRLSPPRRDEARADRLRSRSWRSPPANTPCSPSALWRDVLPTTAHRWVDAAGRPVRALDCAPLNQESASVQWLTGASRDAAGRRDRATAWSRILPQKLAANGLHAPARAARHRRRARGSPTHPAPDGLHVAATFRRWTGVRRHRAHAGDLHGSDDRLLSARARRGAVVAMDGRRRGVDDREHRRRGRSWQRSTSSCRRSTARAGWRCGSTGAPVQTLVVEPTRRIYQIGPLTVPPGRSRARRFIRSKRRRWPAT